MMWVDATEAIRRQWGTTCTFKALRARIEESPGNDFAVAIMVTDCNGGKPGRDFTGTYPPRGFMVDLEAVGVFPQVHIERWFRTRASALVFFAFLRWCAEGLTKRDWLLLAQLYQGRLA